MKDKAVDIATRAIKCAASLPDASSHPIYFVADSKDLVQYMTRDLQNKTYLLNHFDSFIDQKSANATAKELVSRYHVVARNQNTPNCHIDKNRHRPVEHYYPTFIDLYLAMNGRCVSYGIGYFAVFASKLSGTQCKIRYMKEKWGSSIPITNVDFCSLPARD